METRVGYQILICLLYTSDAADDLLCVDLGGRRIIKKKIFATDAPKIVLFNIGYTLSRTRVHLFANIPHST